jgi:hypothetical protein
LGSGAHHQQPQIRDKTNRLRLIIKGFLRDTGNSNQHTITWLLPSEVRLPTRQICCLHFSNSASCHPRTSSKSEGVVLIVKLPSKCCRTHRCSKSWVLVMDLNSHPKSLSQVNEERFRRQTGAIKQRCIKSSFGNRSLGVYSHHIFESLIRFKSRICRPLPDPAWMFKHKVET